MSKRFGLVLVALLIVPVLLTACSSESRDTAEKYMNALLKGDPTKAQELACDSFKDETAALGEMFAAQNIDKGSVDLKFDIGKGRNNEEIIVTGSYKYGTEQDNLREFQLREKDDTRIVLWMKESGGDWCVTDKSEFGKLAATQGEPAPSATEAPAPAATEAAAPAATEAAQ